METYTFEEVWVPFAGYDAQFDAVDERLGGSGDINVSVSIEFEIGSETSFGGPGRDRETPSESEVPAIESFDITNIDFTGALDGERDLQGWDTAKVLQMPELKRAFESAVSDQLEELDLDEFVPEQDFSDFFNR